MGVVSSVEGEVVTVDTPLGARQIRLGTGTTVQKQVAADAGDIQPGQFIVVSGDPGAESPLLAIGVQILGDGTGPPPALPPLAGMPTAMPGPASGR
jgi:hypothetical protein